MTKSQQVFQDMIEYNKTLFEEFKKIHDKYAENSKKFQHEFNEKGEIILQVIRKYENLLCSRSEGSKYGKFSSKLADKFWSFIRKQFPQIDNVGSK